MQMESLLYLFMILIRPNSSCLFDLKLKDPKASEIIDIYEAKLSTLTVSIF